jgi:hypothetical protein
MLRWAATLGILGLIALALALPATSIGRRGIEAASRVDAPTPALALGRPLPELDLIGLNGAPVKLAELRGHRVLLTFERSVDW